jgi:hypothetical protein
MTKVAKVKPSGKRLENQAIAKARYIKGGERKKRLSTSNSPAAALRAK